MLRTLVTFILRLWVDPQAQAPAWEGQVECVRNGTRTHIRNQEELMRFIEIQTDTAHDAPNSQNRRAEQ